MFCFVNDRIQPKNITFRKVKLIFEVDILINIYIYSNRTLPIRFLMMSSNTANAPIGVYSSMLTTNKRVSLDFANKPTHFLPIHIRVNTEGFPTACFICLFAALHFCIARVFLFTRCKRETREYMRSGMDVRCVHFKHTIEWSIKKCRLTTIMDM